MSCDYRNGKKIGDHCGGGGGTRWEEACFATLYPDLARKIGGDTCRMVMILLKISVSVFSMHGGGLLLFFPSDNI